MLGENGRATGTPLAGGSDPAAVSISGNGAAESKAAAATSNRTGGQEWIIQSEPHDSRASVPTWTTGLSGRHLAPLPPRLYPPQLMEGPQ